MIVKMINYKRPYFGTFQTAEEAEVAREDVFRVLDGADISKATTEEEIVAIVETAKRAGEKHWPSMEKETDAICKLVSESQGEIVGKDFRERIDPDNSIPFLSRAVANAFCDDDMDREKKNALICEEETKLNQLTKWHSICKWKSYVKISKHVKLKKGKQIMKQKRYGNGECNVARETQIGRTETCII